MVRGADSMFVAPGPPVGLSPGALGQAELGLLLLPELLLLQVPGVAAGAGGHHQLGRGGVVEEVPGEEENVREHSHAYSVSFTCVCTISKAKNEFSPR